MGVGGRNLIRFMETTFITSRGVTVEFVNIAPLLDILNQQRVKSIPKVPTYTVTTATGASETHEHFHRVVKVKELDDAGNATGNLTDKEETSLTTDEERAAWAKYQADLKAANAAYAENFTKTVTLYGLQYDKALVEAQEWATRQAFVGVTVPTDPLEREWHWLQTELISGEDEAKRLIAGVIAASGTDEEVISQMEALFRDSVGRTNGHTPQRPDHSNGRQGVVSVGKVRASGRRSKKRHS